MYRWFAVCICLWLPCVWGAAAPAIGPQQLRGAIERAAALPRLHALLITQAGRPLLQRAFRGPGVNTPVDVKSLSKLVIDTLIGIAIDRGVLTDPAQKVLPLLQRRAPASLDPRVAQLTLDDLLSMRAGLERTSGPFYGRWVASRNWVRFVLTQPFVDRPGGAMLYSTGNTHLLSAILSDATGRSTLQLAQEWLAQPLGIAIAPWMRDPQGIYFGGNEMTLAPTALIALGETYRLGGSYQGRRVVSSRWVRSAWSAESTDRWGHGYGYGWFISEADGQRVYFGWGFGGQMLYVVPSLQLTVAMTSDSRQRSVEDGFVCALHTLLAEAILPVFTGRPASPSAAAALCGNAGGGAAETP